MKNLILLIMVLLNFATCNAQKSIYDVAINDIKGSHIDLNEFILYYINKKFIIKALFH